METSYQPSPESIALFWQAPATLEHFAALEMALRNGVHLQRAHPDHYSLVSYLERHKNELNHHLKLSMAGGSLMGAASKSDTTF